jgi:mRNA interferase MazF
MVRSTSQVPDSGDIAWLDFSPHEGHEQGGHRPALVLSSATYNRAASLMVCCPMSTKLKGYPFEVLVSNDPPSVVLADQVKSLDWRARRARPRGRVPDHVLAEVRAKLATLIGV